MEKKLIEKLKQDLKEAIEKKDYAKIEEISKILHISSEQREFFKKGLTGYPSVDKVWLKYYPDGYYEKANDIPKRQTVWDIIEEKLYEYYNIPAIEYFKRVISKSDFIDNVYTWARTFRAMGIEENEVVPVYGPFFPDICAMTFALNAIGACPYFLKLAISPEALAEETKDAKIAIVYDEMWPNVGYEFSKPKFKKVLVATASEAMPSPKKEIVSFLSAIKSRKSKAKIPDESKYVGLDKAKAIASYYTGEVKVPFVANRSAFITSSSGTTIGGLVKGTVATNESTISQLQMGDLSGIQYYPGDRCLCHFPPTASTALNVLYMLALYKGETVVLDPRVSENDFYNQIIKLRPNIALTTGSAWKAFFNRVEAEIKQGKKFDFSFVKGWTVGGEGPEIKDFIKWNDILMQRGAVHPIFSGYGLSELFSAASVEHLKSKFDFTKPIMSVGSPYVGINMGIFDENGNELPYNTRGELRINSKSAMKEYYNKPELTEKVKKGDWICTGDLAEMDEKGHVFIYGRLSDCITYPNGEKVYLFDVANKIKEFDFIDEAIVLLKPTDIGNDDLVAHIVWDKDYTIEEKKEIITEINAKLNKCFPVGPHVRAFAEHEKMLPYSKTTLKKDKNGMFKQNTGFIQVHNGKLCKIEFIPTGDGEYVQESSPLENEKVKNLKIN